MKKLLMIASSVVLGVLAAAALAAGSAKTTLVDFSTSGKQANLYTYAAAISAHGRYVVMNSDATNLVPHDTNKRKDVFVRDRLTGKTIRVSVSSSGAQAKATAHPFGGSHAWAISSDGRYVVFVSDAPNLVAHDTNRATDVFVHDRITGRTTRASVSSRGRQASGGSDSPALSADGRYVAFVSSATNLVRGDTNRQGDVFVHDRRTGKTVRVSVSSAGRQAANFPSEEPALSADGRYVAFATAASNLVPHDTNGLEDIFVRDRRTGKTTRVSVTSREQQATGASTHTGSNAPLISGDGRYVAFHSDASNLVPGDTNRVFDIFVRDRLAGETSRVSVSSAGAQANAETLGWGSISADGRYVFFGSMASNLVADDTNDTEDAFIRDRVAQTTILVSRSRGGQVGNGPSGPPGGLSADNRYLVFGSWASNLVANDHSPGPDVFVRDFGGAVALSSN
jgi:Tol biopolymer transport system component